jgi:predicted acyltransferase
MPPTNRLRALDLFRGLTVAGMIVVNCSGSDDVFPWSDHAPWNGFTPADLVFPSFLVVLGVSAALSYTARRARGGTPAQFAEKSAVRAAGLFALGLLVNFVVFREAHGIRWPGVLQRIALCSFGTAGFLLLDMPALEPAVVFALLVGYWLLLTRVPVPGFGPGVLTPQGNLASWLDRRLMGGHLENALQDPEGLLSTVPAFATSLIGLIAGRRLAPAPDDPAVTRRLIVGGALLALLGAAWSTVFPLNKHLWTSSYALLTSGLCLSGLGSCIVLCRESAPRWGRAFESMGRRALAVYVLTGFVYGILEFIPARLPGGAAGNAKLWLNAHLFLWWLAPKPAALMFALVFTAAAAALALRTDRVR